MDKKPAKRFRLTPHIPLFALAFFSLVVSRSAFAQSGSFVPFAMPWDDSSKSPTDASSLNPVPAGVNGRLSAKNGHFYDEKGTRVRFVGVNIAADAAFPTHADAVKIAARLHKYGFNIVRLHHMDTDWAKTSLIDRTIDDTQHLNKEALERLDYFVAQLKKNGVYANINLKVSRVFKIGDGLPDTDKLGYACKPVDYFDPKMIALQRKYAQDLLTHVNPYTKSRYVDDPAVAVVEMNNENTLIGNNWFGSLGGLPDYYRKELAERWNGWLKLKYKTTAALTKGWTANDIPLGPNLIRRAPGTPSPWVLENNTAPADSALITPPASPPPGVRGRIYSIGIKKVGGQNWHIQYNLPGLTFKDGETYSFNFYAKADKNRKISINASTDRTDYHNIGLGEEVSLTTEWATHTVSFRASKTDAGHDRVGFFLGDEIGRVDLCGISLMSGVVTHLPDSLVLEAGNIPAYRSDESAQGKDWTSFLVDLEGDYSAGMSRFLKEELKLKSMLICSQANFGGVAGVVREANNDFIDTHSYWQHPSFPHKEWDPNDWSIPNTGMFEAASGGTFNELAQYRIAGKPYTVSEYMHPAPNDYQAECVPMIAAFAAAQDWDGFYLFDYGMDRGSKKFTNYFAIDANPAKMALMPMAVRIFLRGDIKPNSKEIIGGSTINSVKELIAKFGVNVGALWSGVDVNASSLAKNSFSYRLKEIDPTELKNRTVRKNDPANSPLNWQTGANLPAFFEANSANSKMILGKIGGRKSDLGGFSIEIPAGTSMHDFAVVSLTSLDNKPTYRSASLLLTALARSENQGMKWNADRTSVGEQWGDGPTEAEAITGIVAINTSAKSATIYPLDGTGKRMGSFIFKISGGVLSFNISPASKTVWYEIALN